jgi:ribosomal 30S subunit maturation factor RimM
MADPVAWLVIERGWEVVDASGKRIGKVDEVLGDREADIWDGLTVSGEYVPAEDVAQIVEGRLTLKR